MRFTLIGFQPVHQIFHDLQFSSSKQKLMLSATASVSMATYTSEEITPCCLVLLLVSIVSTYIAFHFIKKRTSNNLDVKFRPPPSPPALPIIGHLHLVGSKLPKSFQILARRYGPLMKIRMGSSTFVVVSNGEVAKEILKTNDLNFASRFEVGPSDYNIYKGTGFITGPAGAYWKFMKSLCITQLFAGAQLDRFSQIREAETMNLVRRLQKCSGEGEACDLTMELATLSNNLVCKMAMSKRFINNDGEAKRMRELISEIMQAGAKLGVNEVFGILKNFDLFGHGKKLEQALWRYDGVIEQIMSEYEANLLKDGETKQEKDLMNVLLETCRDTNAQVKITRTHIKHFIMELFFASIDTLPAALLWTMAELINHPQVFKRLREEINSVVGHNRLVKESDLPNLPYLQAIVKESLRLNTSSPTFQRECTKDCKINGFDVKAKTKVLINAYAIMRDPQTWQDPDKFIPERFLINPDEGVLGSTKRLEMKNQDMIYMPFGGGRRVCVCSAQVYVVMQATIGALVQCFDWRVKDGKKIEISVGTGFSGNMVSSIICYPVTHLDPVCAESSKMM